MHQLSERVSSLTTATDTTSDALLVEWKKFHERLSEIQGKVAKTSKVMEVEEKELSALEYMFADVSIAEAFVLEKTLLYVAKAETHLVSLPALEAELDKQK